MCDVKVCHKYCPVMESLCQEILSKSMLTQYKCFQSTRLIDFCDPIETIRRLAETIAVKFEWHLWVIWERCGGILFKQERKVWSASLYWCNRCPFPQRDLHTKSLGRWNYSCHNNSTHLSVQSIFPLHTHQYVFLMCWCVMLHKTSTTHKIYDCKSLPTTTLNPLSSFASFTLILALCSA